MVDGRNGDPVGEVLRQERLRRRLSLIDVGEQTKVNPRLLEAIEKDDDRALPAPVFTVGLITTYARFLRLSPEPIVAAYRARVAYREPPVRRGPRPYRSNVRLPRLAVSAVALGLVLALAAYLYQQYATYVTDGQLLVPRPLARAEALPPTPRGEADLLVEPPTPTAPPPTDTPTRPLAAPAGPVSTPPPARPTATPTPPPTPTPAKEVDITAKATARVWVQAQADDKVIFSGILNAGDTRAWTAKQKLLIWAGNGGSIEVTFNGKPLGTIGRPGEVVKVTWTAPP